jgi:transposase InsO family protein
MPHHTYHNQIAELDAITKPHQVWFSDLGRIEYHRTVWYLATIEDVATHDIIAHHVGKYHNSQLVLSLLQQAFMTGAQPMIFHKYAL